MDERFLRTEAVLGSRAMERLKTTKVAVFGVGGVGSYAAETLARSGVGNIVLIDYDTVDITNINRQILALTSTVGKSKVEIMKNRILDINPEAKVEALNLKYLEENKNQFKFEEYNYIIDAIDNITAKLSLIEYSINSEIPIISAMGAGNKLDPTKVRISDINKTEICPLARVIRRELKKRNIKKLNVVWSNETPKNVNLGEEGIRKATPASIAFVPSVFGITMASKVIMDIVQKED